jgi:hypothetical protein
METDEQPKMLAEHDGTERIDEMPAIPEWATRGFTQFKIFIKYYFHSTNKSDAPDIEQQDQEAYKFVAAVDALIRKLPAKEPTHPGWQKVRVIYKRVVCTFDWINVLMEFIIVFSFQEDDESPLIVTTQIFADYFHHDYKLSVWHQKGVKWNFELFCVPTSEEHELLNIPLWALPWLRQGIVKESDLSQRIDEMPTLPEWATRGFPNSKYSSLLLSLINQLHRKLDNKRSKRLWNKNR